MNETTWTILSLVLLGITIGMFVLMLIYRRRSALAVERFEAEQRRVDEERAAYEEQKRLEEQQRRDEELRMMFAGLQSNYTSMTEDMKNMLAGNVQQMIEGTVNAMLPGTQQEQPALPAADAMQYEEAVVADEPAPDFSDMHEIIARQEQIINNLNQGYAYQPMEHEDIRRAIEDAVAVHDGVDETDEYDDLKRTIARQEGMIEGILDERKMAALGSVADETGIDKISLVDAYANLEEDVKMLYYGLGGFIMSMPDTVQVDGKYAVLFKYRNKSLFKLYIKNDAPYLSFLLENGMQSELRVEDDISFTDAKEIVAMCIKRVNREMDRR